MQFMIVMKMSFFLSRYTANTDAKHRFTLVGSVVQ